MDLSLTEDQASLRGVFADFFTKESPVEVVRAAEPLGFDERLWDQVVSMGLPTMGVPEATGGGGAGNLDLVLLAIEAGRRLAPVPLLEAIVASNLLAATDAGHDLVSAAADGSVLPTIALHPVREGTARLLPAGAVADVAVAVEDGELVAVRWPAGQRPYGQPPANLGASPLADRRLDDPAVERIVLATGDDARQLHDDAVAQWKLLIAASLEGIRQAALELGVDYVKQRIVFGQILGWFQAVQHRLADLSAAGDGAELLVYEAAWARDTAQADAADLASMAFLFETDLAFKTCRESLQFHGGYGYTLEYDIQLYFRRAKAWPLALGDPRLEHRRLARSLYETPSGSEH